MSGFEENPFGEPTVDNPFAVSPNNINLCWFSFLIFLKFTKTLAFENRNLFEKYNHEPVLFHRILLFSKLPQIRAMLKEDLKIITHSQIRVINGQLL